MQRRTLTHELMAEFFGTFLLILGGDGVVANVLLGPRFASTSFDWNTIVFGWGLSVMVAVYVAGGVSGAHINPAVTLAMAVKRDFPWSKVLPYFVAQVLGAFVGALGVFLAYRDGLVEAGMPGIWATGPGTVYAAAPAGGVAGSVAGEYTLLTAFIAEILGTMVLLLGIAGWIDSGKDAGWAGGLIVGLVVVMVGLTLGGPSGYAINPARDFGPRIFGALVGTSGLFDGLYWLVAPIIGPLIGGPLGLILYDIFIKPGLEAEPA
jgi:glycerol uptake facilitator protein